MTRLNIFVFPIVTSFQTLSTFSNTHRWDKPQKNHISLVVRWELEQGFIFCRIVRRLRPFRQVIRSISYQINDFLRILLKFCYLCLYNILLSTQPRTFSLPIVPVYSFMKQCCPIIIIRGINVYVFFYQNFKYFWVVS